MILFQGIEAFSGCLCIPLQDIQDAMQIKVESEVLGTNNHRLFCVRLVKERVENDQLYETSICIHHHVST